MITLWPIRDTGPLRRQQHAVCVANPSVGLVGLLVVLRPRVHRVDRRQQAIGVEAVQQVIEELRGVAAGEPPAALAQALVACEHLDAERIAHCRTRNTGAEVPVELGTRPGPVTKIRYR